MINPMKIKGFMAVLLLFPCGAAWAEPDGTRLAGDILVLAPGISLDWSAIEGLSDETAEQIRHAWKAGPQTEILRDQLVAMEDGGLGWCPVEPVGFESRVAADVYILGDAALQGDMPKSAFSANVQAHACARAILARLAGDTPQGAKLLNVCYSLAAPDYGFSIADVYVPGPDKVTLALPDGRTTALGATAETHAAEAEFTISWFDTITAQLYG